MERKMDLDEKNATSEFPEGGKDKGGRVVEMDSKNPLESVRIGVAQGVRPGHPSQLNTQEYPHTIEVHKDKLTARYNGVGNHSNDFGSIRTDRHVPSGVGIYYFEVEIVDAGRRGAVSIGLSTENFSLTRQVGTEAQSVGYRGDDGKKYQNSTLGQCYGPFFNNGDIIGCGISFLTNSVFFTKNGRSLSSAFENVRGRFYPTVSLHSPGETVRINLGDRPFSYDIEGHRSDEKAKHELIVHNTRVEEDCIPPLIRHYLAHTSYKATLEAFEKAHGRHDMDCEYAPPTPVKDNAEVKKGSRRLSASPECSNGRQTRRSSARKMKQEKQSSGDSKHMNGVRKGKKKTDEDAVGLKIEERLELRQLVVSGEIEKAEQFLKKVFPGVLDRSLRFQFECQSFIELVRVGELDKAIRYAQNTLATHQDLTTEELQFRCHVMGTVAYQDLESSPAAHLLALSQRRNLADLVNSKVMESLGAGCHSKLERLLRHLMVSHQTLRRHNHNMGVPLSLQ